MALLWKPSFYTLPVRCKKCSSAQIFKTSSAFLEYRRFEARRAVVFCSLSAYQKAKNCQERRLQVGHFTPSIPDAKYRLRKRGYVQKGNFRYLWVKKSWHFYLSLSLLPSFFFFLIQCFWSWEFIWPHFRGKRFGELETYGIRRKEVQVGSGGFSSPFSAQRLTYFFVFLSGLLDLIVRAFYFIFSFILLFCHSK